MDEEENKISLILTAVSKVVIMIAWFALMFSTLNDYFFHGKEPSNFKVLMILLIPLIECLNREDSK